MDEALAMILRICPFRHRHGPLIPFSPIALNASREVSEHVAFAANPSPGPDFARFLPRYDTCKAPSDLANPWWIKDFLNPLLRTCLRLRRFCVVSATGHREGRIKQHELASW
ncbi:MAG TPA: hypothetical protein VL202_24135 [Pararhizobium sp.]|nr:hypothetical protein [Pararhizobium sp.]